MATFGSISTISSNVDFVIKLFPTTSAAVNVEYRFVYYYITCDFNLQIKQLISRLIIRNVLF